MTGAATPTPITTPTAADLDHGSPLRSVRLRITVVATLVTGVAMLAAGAWLLHTVERSLTHRLHTSVSERLDGLRQAIEDGRSPAELNLTPDGDALYYQVLGPQGRIIAATGGGLTAPLGGEAGASRPPPGIVVIGREGADTPAGRFQVVAAGTLDPVHRSVDTVQEGLLVSFPLLLGAVGVLAWLLAGRALRPVEAIRVEVESITGSTLDRRVPVPRSGDEVSRLAHTMNAMLDRLEDASTRQQRFVADASHELRSPVTAIRTELEVAKRTAAPDEWPLIADRLLAEEARLEAVIADLLLLASLDEGAASEHVVVDLAELATDEARRRAPDREGVAIEVDASAAALVHGSRTQLRRAVVNLLDNAGRHARSTVRLSVHQRDGRIRVLVDDDGPGIPEADRERVFERFTRLDDHRARTASSGGAGLGLSLVRRIAERHGGTATVDTAPLGGARVVVDLPRHEPR
jgi:signal transduction histidine kinase